MNALIIFDLNDMTKMNDIRQKMRAKGYFIAWSSDNKSYILPHNIVWKPNTEMEQAYTDLAAVVSQTPNLSIIRCVVLNASPWKAIAGTPINP